MWSILRCWYSCNYTMHFESNLIYFRLCISFLEYLTKIEDPQSFGTVIRFLIKRPNLSSAKRHFLGIQVNFRFQYLLCEHYSKMINNCCTMPIKIDLSFVGLVSKSNDLPAITASLFLSPGGRKFLDFMNAFVRYVAKHYLTKVSQIELIFSILPKSKYALAP